MSRPFWKEGCTSPEEGCNLPSTSSVSQPSNPHPQFSWNRSCHFLLLSACFSNREGWPEIQRLRWFNYKCKGNWEVLSRVFFMKPPAIVRSLHVWDCLKHQRITALSERSITRWIIYAVYVDEVCFYYSWTKIALHNPLVCFLNSFKWYQKTVEHTDHSVPSPHNRRWTWYRKWYVWLIHSELEFLGNLSKTRRGVNMENTVWTRHSFPCCLVASVWMKLPVLTGIVLTAGCSSQTLHSSTSLLLMPRLAFRPFLLSFVFFPL